MATEKELQRYYEMMTVSAALQLQARQDRAIGRCYSGKPGPMCGCANCAIPYKPNPQPCTGSHCVSLEVHKQIVEKLQKRAEVAELMGKSRQSVADTHRQLTAALGDAAGERDRLRHEKADLETECNWLRRENLRLGGKARGAR